MAIQDLDLVIEAMDDYMVQAERRFKLTRPQLLALWELGKGAAHSLKALAQQLSMEPSTLVGIIDRLVSKGLVVKVHDQEDRRLVSLSLSDRGSDVLLEAPHPSVGCLAPGLRHLPLRRVEELQRSLRLLAGRLHEQRLGTVGRIVPQRKNPGRDRRSSMQRVQPEEDES